jgi:hypothetical protein
MHLRYDFVHLGGGEGPARCRVDVAHRSQMQNGGGSRFLVRGFKDQKAIVFTQGPVDVLHLHTELLRISLEDRRTLGRVVDVLDALLRELDVGNESCQGRVSFSRVYGCRQVWSTLVIMNYFSGFFDFGSVSPFFFFSLQRNLNRRPRGRRSCRGVHRLVR